MQLQSTHKIEKHWKGDMRSFEEKNSRENKEYLYQDVIDQLEFRSTSLEWLNKLISSDL